MCCDWERCCEVFCFLVKALISYKNIIPQDHPGPFHIVMVRELFFFRRMFFPSQDVRTAFAMSTQSSSFMKSFRSYSFRSYNVIAIARSDAVQRLHFKVTCSCLSGFCCGISNLKKFRLAPNHQLANSQNLCWFRSYGVVIRLVTSRLRASGSASWDYISSVKGWCQPHARTQAKKQKHSCDQCLAKYKLQGAGGEKKNTPSTRECVIICAMRIEEHHFSN